MKKIRLAKAFTITVITALLLSGCGQSSGTTTTGGNSTQGSGNSQTAQNVGNAQSGIGDTAGETVTAEAVELLSGKHHVNIIIKDKGTISVELDADVAPITVTNFVNLAQAGFYDGVAFHRIMEDFMMQGGDPTGIGGGGSGKTIKGEFAANGVENNLSHTRGAISMARAKMNDSASSQFFIVQEDSLHLDGMYACFGYVTEGMDIVDDICENTEGGDHNGIIPEANRPVIETIEVVD